MTYNIIIIGSGPGGYVAAIRASQLGKKVAVIEKSEIGGVCLNWGCIPTKALLKSASVFNYLKNAASYGINAGENYSQDFPAMIKRSRTVADNMSKGVQFLFKKNNIDVIIGNAIVKANKTVEVTNAEGIKTEYSAEQIIIATGASPKQLPFLKIDEQRIISYRKAMTLDKQPASMLVIGSGAIGSEFAYFYSTIGTKVTLVEVMPNILPFEDDEVSKQAERSFKKHGIKVMTESCVEKVEFDGDKCITTIRTKKGEEKIETDIVLSATGVETNIDNIGLEEVGIATDKRKILVDDYYKTNIEGYYAIGDIVKGPALAHVASAEGIVCVENISGLNPHPIDYNIIPSCTYCHPEVASVGISEKKAAEKGIAVKIGKFPYTASGKATASGNRDGFVKLIFDAESNILLGGHLVGDNVTEMISELVVACKNKITAHSLVNTIHPHPTMSEAIMEAAANALGECIHL